MSKRCHVFDVTFKRFQLSGGKRVNEGEDEAETKVRKERERKFVGIRQTVKRT